MEILPLNQSEIYTDDKLGLRQMIESGQLLFYESEGNHLQFTEKWFDLRILPILQEEH